LELIVPAAEGSLALPLTDQVKLEVDITPVIVAENFTVPPAATAAELGVIVIGVVTDEGAVVELCLPHPALRVVSAIANTIAANRQCDFLTSAS
jgi:hypothetical protein